jgi:ferredoxin
MTNLNNYLNLVPGSAPNNTIKSGITLQPLGHGSGMLGLPGDFTSPSRFVRATFFQTTAPVWATGFDTVVQAFHILNNFDIPVGSQHVKADIPKGLPSATQVTTATDQNALRFYYRTAWNSSIRCIDLKNVDFKKFFSDKTMMERYSDARWAELYKTCLACGTCTYVCPTCQCYDIKEFTNGNEVIRFRCWDSCMYSDFTKMSAGQPRPTQLERFRQRFMHKLVYYPMNNAGTPGCVGCGRCLASCPISMNIVKVAKKLSEEDAK